MKPIDHHPYLTDGDLRTAEDVLEWLDAGLRPPDGPLRLVGAWKFRHDLAERLDRERRQACRRGACAMARYIAIEKRALRHDYERHNGEKEFGDFAKCMAHQREHRWGSYLRRALAYRAAARAR